MKKIKVIHYIPGFNTGGIESRLVDWYKNIDRNKIEFIVIKNNDIESEKLIEFLSIGGRYYNLPHFDLKNYKKYKRKLKEIIIKEKADVIHVHDVSSGFFPLYFAKKYGIKKRILHSRTTGYLPKEPNVLIKKILKKLSVNFATDYFACSVEAGIWGFGKKYKSKVRVIKNGIDLPKFQFNESVRNKIRREFNLDNQIVIGTVSRLSSQKNLLFLIKVFNDVYKKNNNYRLMIVGEGPSRVVIQNAIDELNLSEYVLLVGNHNDVYNYYMAFDIFLGTSYYEGFGTTAIEAQATGLQTILSTGFPEAVEVTNFIKRIPLTEKMSVWSNEILQLNLRERTSNDIKKIEEAGYNAKSIGQELQKFYSEERKGK